MTDTTALRTRRWIGWSITAVLGILLLCTGWVVIRGLNAVANLQDVKASASKLRTDVASGDLEKAARDGRSLARHAASARELTGDPIWGAFEVLPWLGANLTAIREVSAIADDLGRNGVQPVLSASEGIDLTGTSP